MARKGPSDSELKEIESDPEDVASWDAVEVKCPICGRKHNIHVSLAETPAYRKCFVCQGAEAEELVDEEGADEW